MKVKSIAMIIISCMFLSGCWDRTEVKDLALIMATGLDKTSDGNVRVSIQVAIPSAVGGGERGGGKESKNFIIESAVGKDKKDATQKIQEHLSRKYYPAHQQVIVIGESLARDGIQNILDTFSRDPLHRMRTQVLIARGGTAENILKTETVLEKLPGQSAKKINKISPRTQSSVMDLLRDMRTPGIVPVVGAINRDTDAGEGFWLSSAAAFKDGRLAGYLTDEEARGLLWIKEGIRQGYVTTDLLPEKGVVTLYMTRAKSSIHHTLVGGIPTFYIDLIGKGEVVENTSNVDLTQEQNLNYVTQALNASVRKYVESCIKVAQDDLHSDVLGLGEEVYRDDPGLWKNVGGKWEEIFPKVHITLNVQTEVLRPGATGGLIQSVDDQEENR